MHKSKEVIEILKQRLTEQLEAYHSNDEKRYNELEEEIIILEKYL